MTGEEALDLLAHEARTRIGQENAERRAKLDAAVQALREKVAAKKPRRPTLEEMEKACRDLSGAHPQAPVGGVYLPDLRAAADIIKAVREDVIPWLKASVEEYKPNGTWLSLPSDVDGPWRQVYSIDLLRALGEDA